jgi:two-component system response regulator HupR/HoxA
VIRAPGSPLNASATWSAASRPFDLSVLVTGESGTGKEMIARAIHYESRRADKAFITENCGALPDTLLESELFGYKRGAFTGAVEDRSRPFPAGRRRHAVPRRNRRNQPGLPGQAVARAAGRRVPAARQQPSGSVDVRVIAATNRDLEDDVRTGRFREDLYYRLATIAAARAAAARAADGPAAARRRLLDASQRRSARRSKASPTEALACIAAYRWPGNVRELQNEILRMVALCARRRARRRPALAARPAHAGGDVDQQPTDDLL